MISLDTAIIFFPFALSLALLPGPDNIFVLTQSLIYGRISGIFATLGLATGIMFHTSAVAFGVATILETSQFAFSALKYIGAIYLLYLAFKAFRAGNINLENKTGPKDTKITLYKRGLIMNITNPKVAIFFLAFLPQFVDPNKGAILSQFYQLGILMFIATILVFTSIALSASFVGKWLFNSKDAMLYLNRFACLIFISLAAKLAFAQK
jgi:threonine/homoserine/homoserine lactone efflux protein